MFSDQPPPAVRARAGPRQGQIDAEAGRCLLWAHHLLLGPDQEVYIRRLVLRWDSPTSSRHFFNLHWLRYDPIRSGPIHPIRNDSTRDERPFLLAPMSAFEPVVISSPQSALRVEVLPFGLTIQSILVDGQDVVPSYQEPRSHSPPNRAFFAPIVGRYANRLPAGHIEFGSQADGSHGDANLLEFSAPGISHHGGPAQSGASTGDDHVGVLLQKGPFDQCVWTRIPLPEAKVFTIPSDLPRGLVASELFALESPDGDQGYPGHVRVEVLIGISGPSDSLSSRSKGAVHLVYRARLLDAATRATPLSLTHHWGFNLLAGKASTDVPEDQGRIDSHTLRILPRSSTSDVSRLETDARGLSTGKLLPIPRGDPHDFAHGGKKFGDNMPLGGYDHYYFWGPAHPDEAAALPTEPLVCLASPSAGIGIHFRTDQPGMQVYTTNGQPAYPASAGDTGGERKKCFNHGAELNYAPLGNHQRSSAMLEFGAPHATFLHPSLQQAAGTDTLLRQGQVYRAHTSAEFHVL